MLTNNPVLQLVKSLNEVWNEDGFAPMGSAWLPFKTDIRETEQSYQIEAELPGFQKKEIDIDYSAPYLTIKAVRNEETQPDNEENQPYRLIRHERRYGEYVRRFHVQDIDADGIRASLKDGLLLLEVPKRQKPGNKRIEIQG